MERQVTVIGSDAGGTMTDMFVVDEEGGFVVGKASTTPQNESIGFRESLEDAFEYWKIDWGKEAKDILPQDDTGDVHKYITTILKTSFIYIFMDVPKIPP